MAKKKAGSTKKAPSASSKKKANSQNVQTLAVLLFAVGLLLAALTFIQGDRIWRRFHEFLFGMLGLSTYFLAPLCIYIAVAFAKNKPSDVVQTKIWQSGVFLALISGTIEVFGGLPKVEGLSAMVASLFKEGVGKEGGGVIGILTAGPLSFIDSSPGPQIIILLALFVFFMLITGSTLVSLFNMIRKPVDNIENAYAGHMEKKQEQPIDTAPISGKTREQINIAEKVAQIMPKFDIDIDISRDKSPEDFEFSEIPMEPTMRDLAGSVINEPDAPDIVSFVEVREELEPEENAFEGFGVDQPVEYITVNQPIVQEIDVFETAETIPERPHPLEEDIQEAKENDVTQMIQDYLNRIKTEDTNVAPIQPTTESPEEEILVETFRAEVSQPSVPAAGNGSAFNQVEEIFNNPQDKVGIRQNRGKDNQRVDEIPVTTPPAVQTPAPIKEQVFGYRMPPIDLLTMPDTTDQSRNIKQELQENAVKLVETLESFGVKTKVIDVARGPTVTRYELQPSPGVKISRITGLADDIALNLAAAGIRIEAPIPNKAAVGIEVPNKNVTLVRIREIIDSVTFRDSSSNIVMALGKDITGVIKVADISRMPHMLIAGATGSGKSVCINSIIMSILYKYNPNEVKLLMIDPKVVELGVYNGIPHLLVPVVTDSKKAAGALSWAVNEMLKRYKTFAENGVRDITGFNKLTKKNKELEYLPKVVIIIDELADLMMATPTEVEDSICRLAQMARAAGMHLVIATQRPSVDVITGVIKANIPSRVAFAVSSQVDSRTILDMGGAEKLLGSGDMLFYPVGAAKPVRVQGCFVTDKEVEKVVAYVKSREDADYSEEIVEEIDRLSLEQQGGSPLSGGGFDDEDELIPYAIECVVEAGQASTSMLQRRLKLGYARAARIIDQLEERGIVGAFEGSKPRELLIDRDRYLQMKLSGEDQPGGMKKTADQKDAD